MSHFNTTHRRRDSEIARKSRGPTVALIDDREEQWVIASTGFTQPGAIGRKILERPVRQVRPTSPIPVLATLIAFVVVMGIDGFNSMLVDLFMPHLYTPQNELRTLTGMGMGVAIAVLMFLIINLSLRQNPDTNQRIMNGWLELGGALLLNLLVLAAMYGNVALMFWPIAITAWLGITGILYAINVLLTALFMGYEGRVTRMIQLAKPATWALLFTLVELGSLAAARFWLEAQGLIVN